MKVVYIAGPFRGLSAWDIECNIRRAETLALEVWRLGAAALCPHTNTRFFQNAAPDDVWLKGDLELLRRCDAVLVTPDWEKSSGARAEVDFAFDSCIPVFYALPTLEHWLRRESVRRESVEHPAWETAGGTTPEQNEARNFCPAFTPDWR